MKMLTFRIRVCMQKYTFKEKVQYTYSCCFCQTFNLASIELLASIFEAEMFDLLHLNL